MLWSKWHRQFDIILGGTEIRFYFYFMDMFWSINIPSWINKSSERKINWPQKTLSSTLFLGGINVFLRLQDYFHAFGHQITFTNEHIFSTKNELNPQGNIFNCLVLNSIKLEKVTWLRRRLEDRSPNWARFLSQLKYFGRLGYFFLFDWTWRAKTIPKGKEKGGFTDSF